MNKSFIMSVAAIALWIVAGVLMVGWAIMAGPEIWRELWLRGGNQSGSPTAVAQAPPTRPVGIRIRATAVPDANPKGLSPDELAYAKAAGKYIYDLDRGHERFAILLADPRWRDQAWSNQIDGHLRAWQTGYAELSLLSAPAAFAASHESGLEGYSLMLDAGRALKLYTGIASAKLFDEATEKTVTADRHISASRAGFDRVLRERGCPPFNNIVIHEVC